MSNITYLKAIQNNYKDPVLFSHHDDKNTDFDNIFIKPKGFYEIDKEIPWGDDNNWFHYYDKPTKHHIKIQVGDKSFYIWQSGDYIRVGDNLDIESSKGAKIKGDNRQLGTKILLVEEDGSLWLENWEKWQQNQHKNDDNDSHLEIVAITNETDTEQHIGSITLQPWQAEKLKDNIKYSIPKNITCCGNVLDPCPKGLILKKDGTLRLYNWDTAKIVQRMRVEPIGQLKKDEIACYETKKESRCPLEKSILKFETPHDHYEPGIKIYLNTTYQNIIGFGGAFTDAAAINIKEMSTISQDEILEAYFGSDGIGYSVGRVPMGSTDFSTESYSYADNQDNNLSSFKLSDWDINDKIPLIQAANSKRKAANAKPLTLFSSVWTAPPWMKENYDQENHWIGGKLKKDCYSTWALYFSKFFEHYAEYDTYTHKNDKGVESTGNLKVNEPLEFWGCTIQNEPGGALDSGNLLEKRSKTTPWKVKWESMEFSPEDQADFIGNHLGQKLNDNRSKLRKDGTRIKIMCYEDQKNGITIPEFMTSEIPNDPQKTLNCLRDRGQDQFVDGIAFHWYQKNTQFFWYDGDPWCAEPLSKTRSWLDENNFKDKFLFATEACQGCAPQSTIGPATDLNDKWERAEEYAQDIITDLNHGTVGWMDWNLALNMEGGPNWAGNNCDALVLCNSKKDSFYMQPMFYYFAHFTKFIPADSVRIKLDSKTDEHVKSTAFKTPDNHIVLVVQNSDETKSNSYWINVENHGYIHVENMASHSIRTFVIPI